METEVLIVGAGLSGLTAAWQLTKVGIDCRIVEARERTGGRIMSTDCPSAGIDLGPSWVWPGQPKVAQLLTELNLNLFEQPSEGNILYQNQFGQVQQYPGPSPMAGAYRISGGSSALTDALSTKLTNNVIFLEHQCVSLNATNNGIEANISTVNGIKKWKAKTVALALPPRLTANLAFTPNLHTDLQSALNSLPTWMAAHAKCIVIFENAFWKTLGLSGTAMSQMGPLAEIHDASPSVDGPYALFGFIGVPATERALIGEIELKASIQRQLSALFGSEALDPLELIVQDWSQETFTATEEDKLRLSGHPAYGLSVKPQGEWLNKLYFIASETNQDSGGLIEGAVDRATRFVNTYVA